jgi:formate hydrogenlyase subunit 6/NADH:ubiquinone oxidoreductase subunit I
MKEKGANSSYFGNIKEGIRTSLEGLRLSFKHMLEARESRTPIGIENKDYFKQDTGIVTLQYPREVLPVPVNGRYKLHNEIDDCIVCDKCAKVCPVNCIDIEAIKAAGEISKASDGSSIRLYAARFDIDMAKCCFCGLCTTVCPTECLTMTPEYDFSTADVRHMNFGFAKLSEEEAQLKREEFDAVQAAKQRAAEATKAAATVNKPAVTDKPSGTEEPEKKKPFRPVMRKPAAPASEEQTESKLQDPAPQSGDDSTPADTSESDAVTPPAPAPRKPFKPIMRKPAAPAETPTETGDALPRETPDNPQPKDTPADGQPKEISGNAQPKDTPADNAPEPEQKKPNRPIIPKRKPE